MPKPLILDEKMSEFAYEFSNKTKDPKILRMCEAVYLINKFNNTVTETAELIGKTRSVVSDYRKKFKEMYNNKSFKIKTCRRRYYLTLNQEKQFISSFIEKAKKGDIINLKQIHQAYEKTFNRKVAESTVYRLMKRHGWRKIAPRPYHPKKNKEKAEAFKGDLKKSTD